MSSERTIRAAATRDLSFARATVRRLRDDGATRVLSGRELVDAARSLVTARTRTDG